MLSMKETFDVEMVREFMARYGLDPVPRRREEPEAIVLDGTRLTTEVYGWGRVFFAENKARSLTLTWTERTGESVDLPGWVSEIRALVDRPSCLGHYEKDDPECDETRTESGERVRACAWRGRCRSVLKRVSDPEKISAFLAINSDGDLARYAEEDRWDRRRSGKESDAQTERKTKNYESSVELVHALVAFVMDQGGWKLSRLRSNCPPGGFFLQEYERKKEGPYFVLFHTQIAREGQRGFLTPGRMGMQSIVRITPSRARIAIKIDIRTDDVDLVRSVAPEVPANLTKYDKVHAVTLKRVTEEYLEVVASAIVEVVRRRAINVTVNPYTKEKARPKRY